MVSPSSSSSQPAPAVAAADHTLLKTHASQGSREVAQFDHIPTDHADHHHDHDLDYHGHLRSSKQDDRGFTRHDQRDMRRMGKVQELKRNFRTLSTIAFTVILQGTWEVLLAASYQGMYSGGLAGLLWSYVWTFSGFSLVVISLAEMASMAPTSGGQYHW